MRVSPISAEPISAAADAVNACRSSCWHAAMIEIARHSSRQKLRQPAGEISMSRCAFALTARTNFDRSRSKRLRVLRSEHARKRVPGIFPALDVAGRQAGKPATEADSDEPFRSACGKRNDLGGTAHLLATEEFETGLAIVRASAERAHHERAAPSARVDRRRNGTGSKRDRARTEKLSFSAPIIEVQGPGIGWRPLAGAWHRDGTVI